MLAGPCWSRCCRSPVAIPTGFDRVLSALAEDCRDRGHLDLSEGFIDGTFVIAKNGGPGVGLTKRGKGTKIGVSS